MDLDGDRRADSESAHKRVSRALVVTLVIGAGVFLALVMWYLRTAGSIWG